MVADKQSLRKHYLQIRKGMSSFESFMKSWTIQKYLIEADFFLDSKVIGLYYPILNEVQTFRIINQSLQLCKTVCLPAVVDHQLSFYPYESRQLLKIGKYNIMEPIPRKPEINEHLDLIVVPGIVFDTTGNRIGYGKGYYDKFINLFSASRPIIVGLAYNFQVYGEKFSQFDHDVKMDILITEEFIKYFRS